MGETVDAWEDHDGKAVEDWGVEDGGTDWAARVCSDSGLSSGLWRGTSM